MHGGCQGKGQNLGLRSSIHLERTDITAFLSICVPSILLGILVVPVVLWGRSYSLSYRWSAEAWK